VAGPSCAVGHLSKLSAGIEDKRATHSTEGLFPAGWKRGVGDEDQGAISPI